MYVRLLLGLAASVLLLTGCASEEPRPSMPKAGAVYDGPLDLRVDYADDATVAERAGSAGRALECTGKAYDGGGADNESSGATVKSNAADAMQDHLKNINPRQSGLAETGYVIERADPDRVLYSYDVEGRTKIAFVVANDITDIGGATGWGIESWAQCDPSELAPEIADSGPLDVWTDPAGNRVPVTTIASHRGAEHCGWEDITFVTLGDYAKDISYWRDTTGELADSLRTTYDGSSRLPAGATNTTYRYGGRELWLSPKRDAAYSVNLDDVDDVERWPAAKEPIWCM
ncbi:MAG: hypothetical protein JWP10_1214 [Nocardioidaceae bacterium]|nr:hypothetical protein [Nocardioidaceae bacterium]